MKRLIYLSMGITFLLWKICLSQEGMEAIDAVPKTGGTRSLSMGGITIATNQGVEALNGNPGGLALLNGIQISIGGSIQIFGKSDFDYNGYSSKFKTSCKLSKIGVAFPITIPNISLKVTGALGYRRFYDWIRKKVIEEKWFDDYYKKTIVHKEKIKTKGLMNTLSLGLGKAISEKYFFGISINFPVQKVYKMETESESRYPDETYKYNFKQEWDVMAKHFIQFGGIFKVSSKLSIGVSFLMNHGFVIYSDEFDYQYEWEIPTTIDFGIAYRWKPNLLLAAEIQSRPWESWRINNLPIGGVDSGNAYRFGLEYGKTNQFRAGYALDRLPLLDAKDHPVDIHNLTGGIGYQLNCFVLDLGVSYQFVTFKAEKWWRGTWDYYIRELVFNTSLRCCI